MGPLLQTAGRATRRRAPLGLWCQVLTLLLQQPEEGQALSRVLPASPGQRGVAPHQIPAISSRCFPRGVSTLAPAPRPRNSQSHQVTLSCRPKEPHCCHGDELGWPPRIKVEEEGGTEGGLGPSHSESLSDTHV